MNNEDRIERVITLPGSPERVWKALTEPAQLARWFGNRVEVDLRVGGDIFFWLEQRGNRQGQD